MGYRYDIFETPLGWVGALASSQGLRRTTLPYPSPDLCAVRLDLEAVEATVSPETFESLRSRLLLYFIGTPVSFAVDPIDVADASPFLRAAWSACRTIPYGQTRTYGWLATHAGRPRSPRAAGQSMARNRLPVIIPCHRVVASDGGLGGFGSGASMLDLKRRLLDLEARGAEPRPPLAREVMRTAKATGSTTPFDISEPAG